jgi:hypothetical protein
MSTDELGELARFHAFVDVQLTSGMTELTPEEALEQWRALQRTEYVETVAAIKESLDDLAKGERGQLYEEFIKEFREGRGLSN